jgi:hypothetical protein
MRFARSLFAEAKNFDLVCIYDPSDPPTEVEVGDYLILAIPLTVPRRYLLPQILNFFHHYHHGRQLNVLETAHTANYKLHTLRYRRPVLEVERLVFVYRSLYPHAPLWVIADRLQLAPNNHVRDDRFSAAKKETLNRLNSVAGRHLYKVRRRILNVERGTFPNCQELVVSDRVQPFGRARHGDFVQATGVRGDGASEWKDWLHQNYHQWLVKEVLKRNRVDARKALPDSVVEFLSGAKDSIALVS